MLHTPKSALGKRGINIPNTEVYNIEQSPTPYETIPSTSSRSSRKRLKRNVPYIPFLQSVNHMTPSPKNTINHSSNFLPTILYTNEKDITKKHIYRMNHKFKNNVSKYNKCHLSNNIDSLISKKAEEIYIDSRSTYKVDYKELRNIFDAFKNEISPIMRQKDADCIIQVLIYEMMKIDDLKKINSHTYHKTPYSRKGGKVTRNKITKRKQKHKRASKTQKNKNHK